MNEFKVQFFFNGTACDPLTIPELKGLEIFPAVSMIETPDTIEATFNMSIPLGF